MGYRRTTCRLGVLAVALVGVLVPSAPAAARWRPPLREPWMWLLDHPPRLRNARDMGLVDPRGHRLSAPRPRMYDVDGETTPAATVRALHRRGAKVVCYVDVGAYETYRHDAARFPKGVIGRPDGSWDGSFWLDVRQRSVLLPIMRDRFRQCRRKGFDAIEPDEVDGYANPTGFAIRAVDQLRYDRAIAKLAHSLGLSVALKGDVDQASALWRSFDWSLDEQCFQYHECRTLARTFLAHGKAVFEVEYDDPASGYRVDRRRVCALARRLRFNTLVMPLALDGGREPCS